jgi:hypothetical protein
MQKEDVFADKNNASEVSGSQLDQRAEGLVLSVQPSYSRLSFFLFTI